MIEYIVLGISFISLFLAIFWINLIYINDEKEKIELKDFPKVSIVIPAYNEQYNIKETIKSVLGLDYPKDKLEIIVVDDKSTDNTLNIIKQFKNIKIIAREINGGSKAKPVNDALKIASGELFGVVDADSSVERNSLKKMLHFFDDEKTGAVITLMKVRNPKTILEQLQHLEYIFSSFSRKLMCKIDTLYVTPGVLSVYRTDLIKKLGGFDENNLTEDLEIAMRLKANNYNVKMERDAVTYTSVPKTLKGLWNQRLRWFRGFLYNTRKYKGMFLSKEHGAMGLFQIPLNYFTVVSIVLIFTLLIYRIFKLFYDNIIKLFIYKFSIFQGVELPTIKEIITSLDLKLWIPISFSFLLGLFIYHKAHKFAGEKWKFPVALLLYLTLYPLMRTIHWIVAICKEIVRAEKKW